MVEVEAVAASLAAIMVGAVDVASSQQHQTVKHPLLPIIATVKQQHVRLKLHPHLPPHTEMVTHVTLTAKIG